MVNLIQSPSTSHAYSKLLTHGDGDGAHGWWRWRRWRWRWRRPPDPSTGGEIQDQSDPETKNVVAAAVCFANSPPFLGQRFFLVYEGVRRRPETRRCPGANWSGPTRPGTGAAWAPLFWASGTLSCLSFGPACSFSRKNGVVFFPDLISCRNRQKRDFAKNSVRFSSFIQVWDDSGVNYEANCLEK